MLKAKQTAAITTTKKEKQEKNSKQTNKKKEKVSWYGHFWSWEDRKSRKLCWEFQKSGRHILNLHDKCTDSRSKFIQLLKTKSIFWMMWTFFLNTLTWSIFWWKQLIFFRNSLFNNMENFQGKYYPCWTSSNIGKYCTRQINKVSWMWTLVLICEKCNPCIQSRKSFYSMTITSFLLIANQMSR